MLSGFIVMPLVAMMLAMTACAPTAAIRSHAVAAPSWPERQRQLIDWQAWSLRGRLSISTEQTTVQSNLLWERDKTKHHVRLSGPWGVGAAELTITPATMVLITDEGRQYQGSEVEEEIRKRFGWEGMPSGLPHWLVGIPAPSSEPEQLVLDGKGEASLLVQEGWRVRYLDYVPVNDLGPGWRLPRRLQLVKSPVRIMVYVERWQRL